MRWRWIATHLAAAAMGAGLVSLLALRSATPEPRGRPGPDPLRAGPAEFAWREHPPASFPIPPYARHLSGVKVVLDPGHVGQIDKGGDWKRGPTGLREAEVNLRVALYLREFLVAAGADVTLTRAEDVDLGLSDPEDLSARAKLANDLRADVLLSIHHNAGPPGANYTSVFYHGPPGHSPASQVVGRHVVAGLSEALRLDQHAECPLVSDWAIYPGEGFRVLREARVPAVLSEASFHSNPAEEQRLRDPLYNRREAYGLFLGLARWAQAGLPRVRLLEPADGRLRPAQRVVVELDDGLTGRGGLGNQTRKIIPESLVVRLDDKPAPFEVDWARRQVRFTPTREAARGAGRLLVDFTTVFGQTVLHPRIELTPERRP
ncbi:MAG: N-acetylmuramoyl-L-alanine amidase [Phycisphaerae bacterium]|nr:N-acetylmuramoyl-L-alanine amidase [Phycisphaerae bacterium]MCZ2400537.1 N-acetylmuramoyl-L-alanine amidase [Phycisphaerae bacterium]